MLPRGRLRIVAGELKDRRISVPPGDVVRPTPDRVREALFDILGPTLSGLRVLDLYAGTGALGLEALSRGAAHATFVERDARVRATLARNAEELGVVGRSRILAGDVESLLARRAVGGPFELVLADPPYLEAPGERVLPALASSGALVPGSTVVLQRHHRTPPVEAPGTGLVRHRTAGYGRTSLDFYSFSGDCARPGGLSGHRG
jgi:16S rRNA (guanine966-N2)-methyltransferase